MFTSQLTRAPELSSRRPGVLLVFLLLGLPLLAQERTASDAYSKWVAEDVAYIITSEEQGVFQALKTPEERESFIEQFWRRRDPSPNTPVNEFKDEHYRRLAYAREHFTAGLAGWRTDRGRIYIIHGAPDDIESHPGGAYLRPYREGGGQTSTFPFEKWWYRHLEGIGDGIELEFVDDRGGGLYQLTSDPNRKDAFLYAPNAGLTDLEAAGAVNKDDRILGRRSAKESAYDIDPFIRNQDRPLEKLLTTARLNRPPTLRFKELAESVTARVSYNTLPFQHSAEALRLSVRDTLVPLTVLVANADLSFQSDFGMRHSTVNLYGRVTTISGRIAGEFEDVLQTTSSEADFATTRQGRSIYQRPMILKPGVYKLNLILKDMNSTRMGTAEARLEIPAATETVMSVSSVVLAEAIEAAEYASGSLEQFVYGALKVVPRVNRTLKAGQSLGVYFQLYNAPIDQSTQKLMARVEFAIVPEGKIDQASWQDVSRTVRPSGNRWIFARLLQLSGRLPGRYQVLVRATDPLTQGVCTTSAAFTLTPE